MEDSIFIFLDLETQKSNFKTGQAIYDLSILLYKQNYEPFYFEANKTFKTFPEYAESLIDELYKLCQGTPHDNIYFIAHNGFDHDYMIFIDNLIVCNLLDYFYNRFEDSIFLDTCTFFRDYMEYFNCKEYNLQYLFHKFIGTQYNAHRSSEDVYALFRVCIHYISNNYTILSFLLDASNNNYNDNEYEKTLDLIINNYFQKRNDERKYISENKKIFMQNGDIIAYKISVKGETETVFEFKNEYFIRSNNFRFLFKQLQAAFYDAGIRIGASHFIENGLDLLALTELGSKEIWEIKSRLSFIRVSSIKEQVVKFCIKLASQK